MIKCEKCGKELPYIMVNEFLRDNSDADVRSWYKECEENAVVVETNPAWTGYELTAEEQVDTITCPFCGKFPFECDEIQTDTIVRVICFKRSDNNG